MIEIRKTITLRETVFSELGVEANRPITRAVGMAVIRNPLGGATPAQWRTTSISAVKRFAE